MLGHARASTRSKRQRAQWLFNFVSVWLTKAIDKGAQSVEQTCSTLYR